MSKYLYILFIIYKNGKNKIYIYKKFLLIYMYIFIISNYAMSIIIVFFFFFFFFIIIYFKIFLFFFIIYFFYFNI